MLAIVNQETGGIIHSETIPGSFATDCDVQMDDKIVVVASFPDGDGSVIALVRYNSALEPDLTFSSPLFDSGGPNNLKVLPDDSILIWAGYWGVINGQNITNLAKLDPTGIVVSSFSVATGNQLSDNGLLFLGNRTIPPFPTPPVTPTLTPTPSETESI
jgi:hypothetical protein